MKILWIVLLFLVGCKSDSFTQSDSSEAKDSYKLKLEQLIKDIDRADNRMIESSIPTSQQDALVFYALDYDKNTSDSFRKLLIRINEYAVKDESVLIKYLYLSEFVDGYFAEDYFDDIEKIANAQKDLLCRTLSKADKSKVKRLNEISAKYCHQ